MPHLVGGLGQTVGNDAGFGINDGLDLSQEPRIDFRELVDLLDIKAVPEGLRDFQQPVKRRARNSSAHHIFIIALAEAF